MRFLEARASVLLALAFERRGDKAAAFEALDAALCYADTEPMVNSFVDDGRTDVDAAQQASKRRGQTRHYSRRADQAPARQVCARSAQDNHSIATVRKVVGAECT